ncbi:VOC family protein [Mucilaginibacter sp. McL0603]|uniref:VOC family protein n=1 Tax=Mucilaginibacter sp. McL0603 TaxID=3415670 RepID=UPI003CE96536
MENNQPNIQYAAPFFMVSNMEASLNFYTEGLGFSILNTWTPRGKIEWCWLQREGGPLMLQEARISESKPYLAGDKPGAGVTIFYQCKDSLTLYHEFIDRAVAAHEPFVGNGLWDVKVIDPDGYQLHFESPTDVPEETKYSEWVNSK